MNYQTILKAVAKEMKCRVDKRPDQYSSVPQAGFQSTAALAAFAPPEGYTAASFEVAGGEPEKFTDGEIAHRLVQGWKERLADKNVCGVIIPQTFMVRAGDTILTQLYYKEKPAKSNVKVVRGFSLNHEEFARLPK